MGTRIQEERKTIVISMTLPLNEGIVCLDYYKTRIFQLKIIVGLTSPKTHTDYC